MKAHHIFIVLSIIFVLSATVATFFTVKMGCVDASPHTLLNVRYEFFGWVCVSWIGSFSFTQLAYWYKK